MGKYYLYDPPNTLTGDDIIIINQDVLGVPVSKSATIQNLINDIIQPLVDAATISNISDIGDVTVTTPIDGQVLIYQAGLWVNSTSPAANPFDQDLNTTDTPTFTGLSYLSTSAASTGSVMIGNAGNAVMTSDYEIMIGYLAGRDQGDGWANVYIGYEAGKFVYSGYNNVAIGQGALGCLGDAGGNTNSVEENVFIGYDAGWGAISPYQNVVLGVQAGYNMDNAFRNVVAGYGAGYSMNNAKHNVVMGTQAAVNLRGTDGTTQGDSNIIMGYQSNFYNDEGSHNVILGTQAGFGSSGVTDCDGNVFIGYQAGFDIQIGDDNVAIGGQAGQNLTDGFDNVFIGQFAGQTTTTGQYNVCIGYSAGTNNATGSKNIFIGYGALAFNSGPSNVCIIGGIGGDAVNVGLGTINPQYTIDAVGDINITGDFRVNGSLLSTGVPRTVSNIVANPATQNFTLPSTVTDIANTDVWVNGIKLVRTTEYTLDGGGPTYTDMTISNPTIALDDDVEIITWE